jgi:hypothetical protein
MQVYSTVLLLAKSHILSKLHPGPVLFRVRLIVPYGSLWKPVPNRHLPNLLEKLVDLKSCL